MRHIAEAARTTPVMHETEVLVVGGGPGGLAAALAAARAGAATTLVDRYGCLGGVITQVGVDTLAWYRHEGTIEAGGIGAEFERRAQEMGARRRTSNRRARRSTPSSSRWSRTSSWLSPA